MVAGKVPMPLYTCLHVKKNVSAKIFQVNVVYPLVVGEVCVRFSAQNTSLKTLEVISTAAMSDVQH